MRDTIEYNGCTYTRVKGKWVDKNYMLVTHLQKTLDKLFDAKKEISGLSTEELIQEGDLFKDADNANMAIRYYEEAMKAETPNVIQSVLPRLTSCYRAQGQPDKAIEEYESKRSVYGEIISSAALCTSIAAAYCDIRDYVSAKKFADKAYAKSNGKASGELKAVYGRIRKETTGTGKYE